MSARVVEGGALGQVESFSWALPGREGEGTAAWSGSQPAPAGGQPGASGTGAGGSNPAPVIGSELLELIQRQAGRVRELEFETTRLQSELAASRAELARATTHIEAAAQDAVRSAAEAAETARAEGFHDGQTQARQELDPLLSRLARTVEDLSLCRRTFRKEAEEDVVRLSVAIGRRILHRELAVDATALMGLIRACLDRLDQRELHRLRLCPSDRQGIEPRLVALGLPKRVELVDDPALERGSVLFETTRGTLDASIATQLEEIERGFIDHVRRQP